MPARIEELNQLLQDALRNEPALWSPQCPEPETLLDWIEQEETHPTASRLRNHIASCVYCRREVAAIGETWFLAGQSVAQARRAPLPLTNSAAVSTEAGRTGYGDRGALPRRVAVWTRQLMAEGFVAPMKAVQKKLTWIDRLTTPSSQATARSGEAPTDLSPAFTAVRSIRPTLQWSPVERAQEYRVVVAHQKGQNNRQVIWKGSSGVQSRWTLPEEAGLNPGGVYLWQVIAYRDDEEYPSAFVGITVVTQHVKQQIEALEEQVANSFLGLIGLYESHGLYEEALRIVETRLHDSTLSIDTTLARTLHERLQNRYPHEPSNSD